jgi:predicted nucleic acid-binding Zn ribbon protein
LQEKFCPKCGKESPSHAKFCEGCGALVNEDKPRQEDKYDRILMHLWKVLFYPLAYALLPLLFCIGWSLA